jgi:protein-arginine kinase activator protein McsA|tara:strand:+ start:956 stop:1153 length:198 start_codon:yes stop_codon:yes gene_type:complete
MEDSGNYIEDLFIRSINHLKTDDWEWPGSWNSDKRIEFLNESLEYAINNELFEQCSIIRDVKETI